MVEFVLGINATVAVINALIAISAWWEARKARRAAEEVARIAKSSVPPWDADH